MRKLLSGLLMGAMIGALGAVTTVFFRWVMSFLERLLLGQDGSLVQAAIRLEPWHRALLPALGGIAAGYLLRLARQVASLHRQEYMEAVVVGDGLLEVRAGLIRTVASLLVVCTGGAVGREGAMVSLSTIATSGLGRLVLRPQALHLAVACGAAAGLAAAYDAPLASSIFVAEILLGRLALDTEGPLIVAAVASHLTVAAIHTERPSFLEVPHLGQIQTGSVLLMLIVGFACAGLAPVFLHWLEWTRALFRALPLSMPWTLGLGGLIVGLLSIPRPEVWGNGYSVVQRLLDDPFSWQLVATILIVKIIAIGATTGSGAPGGVFTPTLFVGASLGTLFGYLLTAVWPTAPADLTLCTLAGMAAFMAGTTHAPLMAALMVTEMTDSESVLPALLPACVVAAMVARYLEPKSVYTEAMKERPLGPED